MTIQYIESFNEPLGQPFQGDANLALKSANTPEATERKLNSQNLNEFLAQKFPPRKLLLDPIICEKGLAMLYAPRGLGKTFVALSIGYAVASGTSMLDGKWKANGQHKVLLIDGEMPAADLQKRLSLIANAHKQDFDPTNFCIITADSQEYGIPDLASEEGQQQIEEHLDGVSLLIIDNLSALCRYGRENESESWSPMQEWLLSLRRKGIAVLIVHHANKNGSQRGNSKKEDLLDTVIALRKASDYKQQDGAKFEVHYEKARGFSGEIARSFSAKLIMQENTISWEVKDIDDCIAGQQLLQRYKEGGITQRELADKFGMSKSTLNRQLQKAQL